MKLPGIFIIFVLALQAFAFEDLGPLASVRSKRPELFVPGNVLVVEIKGTPCYVFSGEAEQSFTGDFAESESELYDEAVLAAKSNFYEHLSKGDKKTEILMSGCQLLYRYNDKKIYTAILFVPKANVKITKKSVRSVVPAKKQEKTGNPLPAQTRQGNEAPAIVSPVKQIASQAVQAQSAGTAPKAQPDDKKQAAAAPAESKAADQKTAVSPARADSPKQPEPVSAESKAEEQKPALSPAERRIAKYSARVKKNPTDVLAHIALGDLYKRADRASEAAASYAKAIALLENNKFFDQQEKLRLLSDTAALYEMAGKLHLALKYNHLILRQPCSPKQRQEAVAAITRLRMKTLD